MEPTDTNPAALYFVRAVSPLHVGTDASLGAIKLPTMRDAVTGHPILPGSSLRGVLREEHRERIDKGEEAPRVAFGPPTEVASDHRGALVLSDARALFLAAQSLKGTFAWVTSRQALRAFARDLDDAGLPGLPRLPEADGHAALVGRDSALTFGDRVSVRELLVPAKPDPTVDSLVDRVAPWLWPMEDERSFFRRRVAVLPDVLFDATARWGLEVRARVPIDSDKGTAQASGPWTEEHIPTESVLVGLAFGRTTRYRREGAERTVSGDEVLGVLRAMVPTGGKKLRLGGHSGIGLGRAVLTLAERGR